VSYRLAPVVLLALALPGTGCVFDSSGLEVDPTDRYECPVEINEYGIGNPAPTMVVVKGGAYPAAWAWKRFEIATIGPPLELYVNDGHVPYQIPLAVGGSYLLQVDSRDRTSSLAVGFLSLTVGSDQVDRFWIAFDSRALTAPSWLRAQFTRDTAIRPVKSTACANTLGMPPSKCETTYHMWRPTNPGNFATVIALGGNNAPGVVWKNGQVGEQYLLLVRMKPSVTAVNLRTLGTLEVSVETNTMPTQSQWIIDSSVDELVAWLSQQGNAQYLVAINDGRVKLEADPNDCELVCWVVAGGGTECVRGTLGGTRQALAVNAWPRSCDGLVDPTVSSGVVTLVESGNSSPTQLDGQVKFYIDPQSNVVLGAVDLVGGNVSVDDVSVEHISVGHDQDISAICTDPSPAGAYRLCEGYEVPAGQFIASAACSLNGAVLALRLENDQPMALTIDHNARTFHLSGGPLSSTFQVNDEPREVQLSIDITGFFVNFAPVASALETPRYWECEDNSQALVTLYGSASFDDDGQSDIAGYLWLEDTGELSQTVLGTTQTVVRLMSFGIHRITLVVTDQQGISSSESFDLEVGDSQIDVLDFPPDVYVEPDDPNGAVVDPGTATGSDYCSGVVLFTDDVPPSHHFSIGFTPVRWTAEDLRGNLEVHTQGVYVLYPIHLVPPAVNVWGDPPWLRQLDPLVVMLSIEPQGLAMVLDLYVLLETPDRALYSLVDGIWIEDVLPMIDAGEFGETTFEQAVFEGILGEAFPGYGAYRFKAVLVPPGMSPLENGDIVGTGWSDIWLDSNLFADGFESGDTLAW